MRRLTLLIPFLLAVGCGGGGSSSKSPVRGRASAVVTFVWPQPSRLIPYAAKSVKVEVAGPGLPRVEPQVVTRADAVATGGTSRIVFEKLQVGTYTVTATAYGTTDATGVAQAKGSSGTVEVKQQEAPTEFTCTMQSEVRRGEVAGPDALGIKKTGTFTARFYNEEGREVLVDPSSVSWRFSSLTDAGSAGVGPMQHKAKAPKVAGSGQVTAAYSEQGTSPVEGTLGVQVKAPTYVAGGAIGQGSGLPGPGSPSDQFTLYGLAGTYTYSDLQHSDLTQHFFLLCKFDVPESGTGRWLSFNPEGAAALAVTPTNEPVVLDGDGSLSGGGVSFATGIASTWWEDPVRGLAVDAQKNVYVLTSAPSLKVFSRAGVPSSNTYGSLPSGLVSLAVTPSGTIYASDATRTYRLTNTGAKDPTFPPVAGTGVAVDTQGLVYTIMGSKVNVYDEEGDPMVQLDLDSTFRGDKDDNGLTPTSYTLVRISIDPTTNLLYAGANLNYPEYRHPTDFTLYAPPYMAFKVHRYGVTL